MSLELLSLPFTVAFDKGQITLHSVIAKGDYGGVYRGYYQVHDSTGECVAKCCLKSSVDLHRLMFFRREAALHACVSSGEGIVTLYDTFENESFIWIIMKYYPEGDLWNAIVNGHFEGRDEYIGSTFSKILEAVAYCHSKNVYHRDIKPENILLDENGTKAVLADFGLASGVEISGEMRCGSPYYMSPESWGGLFGIDLPYQNAPHDVWSLGVVLINLICGSHVPWKQATRQDPAFRRFLNSPRPLLLRYRISHQVCNLLERVFKVDPRLRITLKDLRREVDRIKVFSRPKGECEIRKLSIPRAISGILSYPFRLKSRNNSQDRLLSQVFEDELGDRSVYSEESFVSTNLSHCCVSLVSSGSVVQLEEPTVRLVNCNDPSYHARPVFGGEETST